MPIADKTNDTTGNWKMTPAPNKSQVKKLKYNCIEKLFSTCGAPIPLKNSRLKGINTK